MKTPPPTSFVADLTNPQSESPENPIKFYYLYIGNGIEGLDKKSDRFVIESEKLIKKGFTVQARVVARNKSAYHKIGAVGNYWTNLATETDLGLYPVFVRVHQEWVEKEKFFEKSL